MKSRMFRSLAAGMSLAVVSSGCLMSRLVDRAFLGVTVRRPTFADRKATGMVLLPITFVIDVATFPIQALLVVILGDNFPFHDAPDALNQARTALDSPTFRQLGQREQAIATAELEQLLQSQALTQNSALSLQEDGHWLVIELGSEAKQQLLARAASVQPATLICER
jgi:hypothetical protein